MINLKVGMLVELRTPEDLILYSDGLCSEGIDYVFDTLDVIPDMLEDLGGTTMSRIDHIDEDGDIEFVNLPWTWPKEVVKDIINE